MARLSTHVLDTVRGLPAAGVVVDVHRLDGPTRRPLASSVTNADGRTGEPLLSAERLDIGVYELTFHVGAYLRRVHAAVIEDPPFLDDVVVRVGIADAGRNYHVPLLLAPYGYSVYRGS